jgi:phage host-nuclease inhibitor protein Gam
MRTVEAVVLLRSKVEQLDQELAKTNEDVRRVIGTIIQIDRRLVRLETIEELRSGAKAPPRLEG